MSKSLLTDILKGLSKLSKLAGTKKAYALQPVQNKVTPLGQALKARNK